MKALRSPVGLGRDEGTQMSGTNGSEVARNRDFRVLVVNVNQRNGASGLVTLESSESRVGL